MNYATGQMARIVRLVSTDPRWPGERVVRTVPLMRRAAWRPWPWRLWGGPSLAYGRSIDDYPGMQPYYDIRHYPPYYSHWDGGGPYAAGYATGYEAPADVHAAAQALSAAIQAAAAHSMPPAWRPTYDFQRAFNHAFGPLGGLGSTAQPELLQVDGIYGPRTELALSHVLGSLSDVMAMYGAHPGSAVAGAAPHQESILAGTSIDPNLALAVEQLSTILSGRPGIQAIADNASRGGGDVCVLPAYAAPIQQYIQNVLLGVFMGFPIAVRVSGPVILQQ